MQDKEQLYLFFKDELEKTSLQEENEILKKFNEIEKKALIQVEEEIKRKIDKQINKQLIDIESEMQSELYNNNEFRRKSLIEKREFYVEKIFNEAKQKLLNYVTTDKYQPNLIKQITNEIETNKLSNYTILLRKEDVSFVKKEIKMDVIQESSEITIGGFILIDNDSSIVFNESLDTILNDQKEWFFETSGLMIR